MEVIGNLAATTKRLAEEEEELKKEVDKLKSELIVEEQNLEVLKKDSQLLASQSLNQQQALEFSKRQVELIKSFRNTFRRSLYNQKILEKFIQETDPTSDAQIKKLHELKTYYDKMIESYEIMPTYGAIIQEELNEKELANLILNKRNELMKLEADKEL